MALTEVQLNEIEYQTAMSAASNTGREEELVRQRRADALRQAQAIVFENRRLLTASEAADITASDVTALADQLLGYVNG